MRARARARHVAGVVLRPTSNGFSHRAAVTFVPAARERLYIHPRRLGPRHITPPSGTPRRPLLWREVSATQPITPPPRAAPLPGAAPVGDDALESDADSPAAGRFSVPTIGRAHTSHTERRMARGDVRIAVTLACEEC